MGTPLDGEKQTVSRYGCIVHGSEDMVADHVQLLNNQKSAALLFINQDDKLKSAE